MYKGMASDTLLQGQGHSRRSRLIVDHEFVIPPYLLNLLSDFELDHYDFYLN